MREREDARDASGDRGDAPPKAPGGRFARVKKKLLLGAALVLGLAAGGGVLLDALFPFPMDKLTPPGALIVSDRNGVELRWFMAPDGTWRLPVTDEEVPELLRLAVIAAEDRRFRLHPGVDPLAVVRAAWQNLASGRVVSGGSTLTMQLARMAEPRPRTFAAKCVEAFRAVQITLRLSKDEQLALWLSRAPMGGNLEGVGAAARLLFGKRPAELSAGEIALLAVLPRAPTRLNPARNPEAARAARDATLRMLAEQGVLTPETAREAMRKPLPERAYPPPFLAPHAAEAALRKARALGPAAVAQGRIQTTLEAGMQRRVQAALAARASWLRAQSLENAAAVVLDARSGEILAYAGSIDYLDLARHGPIDAVRILRSPGSALKPFLYALAMDDGLIAPESRLLDVPTDYAGYVARNFDGRHAGPVTAREALARSLNVPAVRLLADVGVPRFLDLLRAGGLSTLDKPPGHYGLPLALGACEVRLLDLTALYASLEQGGEWRAPRLVQGGEQASATRLFSPEAAWLTHEILATVARPDLPEAWRLTRDAPAMSYKTGTSFGHRDAWAVGLSGGLAVGVWAGNLDGSPIRDLSGASVAAPILFDVLRAVAPAGDRPAPPEGLRLARAMVCEESRQLPTELCERSVEITVISGRTRLVPDTMRRRAFVDARSGLAVSGECLAGREVKAVAYTAWPPELLAFWRSRGIAPENPAPALDPACGGAALGHAPRIVSPSPATPYLIRPSTPLEHQRIALTAQAESGVARLSWFMDGDLAAFGPPHAPLFVDLRPGRHRIAVVDDHGRMDAVTFEVRLP